MYNKRQSFKNKKILNNITKNIPPKALQLPTTNSKKKPNIINNFLPFSLIKSRSIVPFSSNTSRNQKYNILKNSFENLLNNQKSLRNSTIKNNSLINTIIKPKSKSKSKSKPKQKRGISSQKPKINNMKNLSYLSNNEFIKNIILFRKNNKSKNKNKNNLIKNKNNKSQNNNININYLKSRPNSIRCSLTYINRYSYISKHGKPKLKYDDCICITSNEKNNNKKINNIFEKEKKINRNPKWIELLKKFENLKNKTNSLLNNYYTLTENLSNELEMLNSNYDKNIFANNKTYDYRKKLLIYDKNDEDHLLNEFIDNRYINTDINNNN